MAKILNTLQRNIIVVATVFTLSLIGLLFALPLSVHATSLTAHMSPEVR
ncbi:MAG: hypothetical protein V4449_00355 [Patescibacteria group bacterium]